MASTCPSCNKFCPLEMQDPEEESFDDEVELDEDDGSISGTVTANVRIVRCSECCGDEMKEASLEMSCEVNIPHEKTAACVKPEKGKFVFKKGHSVVVEQGDPEPIEEGGGRYKKSFFGASIHFTIHCECGTEWFAETLEDKVAASSMDELT